LLLGDIDALLTENADSDIAVLGFRHTYGLPGIALSPSGDTTEAAKNLFAAMRELDATPGDLILAERLPDSGLGRAVNDRLSRAAFK
ncbi:MAG: L-threonylcarbamoyladenylate synthase type 1 TsaC, partial [Flavobacteriales bacterium]|nr:L-threonylcarbamoyladenylate synthase type 1 TsaC [Flavobacteriales bacterium]